MDNLTIFKNELEQLKGQLVISNFNVYRLIALVEDDMDYYYCLYDGRTVRLTSCAMRLTPLRGFIPNRDYEEMVRICELNHYDQPKMFRSSEDGSTFNIQHKREIVRTVLDGGNRFIVDPCWDII